MYLHDAEDVFSYLVAQTERAFGLIGNNVIKDYYIYVFLKELTTLYPPIVFKGGTALSKCYQAINRFSEDIDLGVNAIKTTEGQRKKLKQAIVEAASTLGLNISNIDETRSRRNFNRYFMPLQSRDLSKNDLMIETALMTPVSPTNYREITSFIYDYCIQSDDYELLEPFDLAPFSLTVSSLERTFVDKVYAICDYYVTEQILDRQSRHIYDLHKLLSTVALDDNMVALFEQVRQDREGSDYCPSAKRGVDLSALVIDIVKSQAYKDDYNAVTMPLLYENVTYDEAIESLEIISEFLRIAHQGK